MAFGLIEVMVRSRRWRPPLRGKAMGGDAMPEFELIDISEKSYLFTTKTCSIAHEDISKQMGEALSEVWKFMQTEGIAPSGGAITVYCDHQSKRWAFRAGFSVRREYLSKSKGAIGGDVIPTGEYLHSVHKGPYRTLGDHYGLMTQYAENIGREVDGPTWEAYLNDPNEVPEQDLLTEVFLALK
jgi:AraC family transcriptional regulator